MKSKKILTMLLALSVLPMAEAKANDYADYETGAVMVTTGTLTEALIEDVPSTIEVITAEEIEQMNAIDARDILARSNKVLVQGVGGGGIMIRGFGSSYTTVLVNGRQPSGFGFTGSGGTANILQFIPAASIERVEILYGSAGAKYGTNSAGGVINIITKDAGIKPEVVARTTLGNLAWTNDLYMDFGKIGKFDGRANITHSKLHEYKDKARQTVYYNPVLGNHAVGGTNTSGVAITSGYDADAGTWNGTPIGNEFFANAELGFDINDNHRLSLFADYFDIDTYTRSQSGAFDTTTGELTSLNDISASRANRYKYSGALVYDGNIGNHSYSLDISMSKAVSPTFENVMTSATGTTPNYIPTGDATSYENYNVSLRDSWFINDNNILTVGGDIKYDVADTEASSGSVANLKNHDRNDQIAYAAYAQYELALIDSKLLLFPFLRYDNSDFHSWVLSPQLGATYEFLPNQRIKANVGYGFKAPTLSDGYLAGSSGSAYTLPNPNLKSERSLSYELAYQANFDLGFGMFTPSVSAYRTDFKDFISSRQLYTALSDAPQDIKDILAGFGYTTATRSVNERINIGSAHIQGIEAELGLDFLDDFNAALGYRFTDAWNNETDTRMVGAMHSFTGSVGYNNQNLGIVANIWGKYYMDTYRTECSVMPIYFDYFTTGFDLSKSFVENKYRITLSGDNVFTSERKWENYEHVTYPIYNISFSAKF